MPPDHSARAFPAPPWGPMRAIVQYVRYGGSRKHGIHDERGTGITMLFPERERVSDVTAVANSLAPDSTHIVDSIILETDMCERSARTDCGYTCLDAVVLKSF